MPKVLMIDHEKCTSCRLCELVCSEAGTGAFRPSRSRIRVAIKPDDAFYFPMVCMQCDDAPCVEACPSEALVCDPDTGAVVVVEQDCNECGLCEPACPYGVIRCWDGKAHKCELCGGDPECVRFCAPGALRYEAPAQRPETARRAYADRLLELAREARP